jgi:hypothetical protein
VKKTIVLALLAVSLAGSAWAEGMAREKTPATPTPEQVLSQALQDSSSTQLGSVTLGEVQQLMDKMALAQAQDRYVVRARTASMMLPGAGQFMTGNPGTGALFLAGDLAIVAGTLVGAYFLLPSDLKFTTLNYFTTPLATIEGTWKAHTILEYLPAYGVMAGGTILDHVLRAISAGNAAQEAREALASGKVNLRPTTNLGGQMGMGMMFSY